MARKALIRHSSWAHLSGRAGTGGSGGLSCHCLPRFPLALQTVRQYVRMLLRLFVTARIDWSWRWWLDRYVWTEAEGLIKRKRLRARSAGIDQTISEGKGEGDGEGGRGSVGYKSEMLR